MIPTDLNFIFQWEEREPGAIVLQPVANRGRISIQGQPWKPEGDAEGAGKEQHGEERGRDPERRPTETHQPTYLRDS
jgi:hypothetical protein